MTDEETNVQIDETKDYIHSDEFKEVLKKAAPSRLKIMLEYSPEMRDIKEEFVEYMAKAADKEDDNDFKKEMRKDFKKVVDFHHYMGGWPKPDSPAKLDKLAKDVATAIKYLDFAQITSFRDFLAQYGVFIDDKKTKTLKDDYPNLNEGSWENLRSMLDDGSTCQGNICHTADEIKINIFENDIPDEMRFSKDNKVGIKKGPFNKMVTAEALKSQRTNEKMKKFTDKLIDNSVYSITREELLKEHYADLLEEQDDK